VQSSRKKTKKNPPAKNAPPRNNNEVKPPLPKDLNRWFEGVHFNAGISSGYNQLRGQFEPASLSYLATAADYVWNPRGWDAAESVRRARRFVAIMFPLVQAADTRGP
jgi:hypothetical protein